MAAAESFAMAGFGIRDVGTSAPLPQRWLVLSTSVGTPRKKKVLYLKVRIVFFFNIVT
jgi:hypothetical protein